MYVSGSQLDRGTLYPANISYSLEAGPFFNRPGDLDELRPLFLRLQAPKVKVMFKSPYFAWLLPLFGAFIIASPFPDEVGVGMLGLSKIKQWQFFALAFILNAVGIFVGVARVVWSTNFSQNPTPQ